MQLYKIDSVQYLEKEDSERRLQFLVWFIIQFKIDNLFEKTFYIKKYFNLSKSGEKNWGCHFIRKRYIVLCIII